jgi:hypothetical protein
VRRSPTFILRVRGAWFVRVGGGGEAIFEEGPSQRQTGGLWWMEEGGAARHRGSRVGHRWRSGEHWRQGVDERGGRQQVRRLGGRLEINRLNLLDVLAFRGHV